MKIIFVEIEDGVVQDVVGVPVGTKVVVRDHYFENGPDGLTPAVWENEFWSKNENGLGDEE